MNVKKILPLAVFWRASRSRGRRPRPAAVSIVDWVTRAIVIRATTHRIRIP